MDKASQGRQDAPTIPTKEDYYQSCDRSNASDISTIYEDEQNIEIPDDFTTDMVDRKAAILITIAFLVFAIGFLWLIVQFARYLAPETPYTSK